MQKFWDLFKGRERMIFALLGGIIFMIVKAVFPQLPFSEESTLALFGLIAAYILGEGLSGQQMGDNLKELLKSQKFIGLLAGLLLVFIRAFFPQFKMTDNEFISLVALLVTFITGAGISNAVAPKVTPVVQVFEDDSEEEEELLQAKQ